MKKAFFKILVCMVLGAMTTSCVWSDDEIPNVSPDTEMICAPATDTHYSAYCIDSHGSRLSTLAPYIYIDEASEESSVVDAYCVGDYLEMSIVPLSASYYTENGINFVRETYKVALFFDTYVVRYYFVVVLPRVYSSECKHYNPSFELIDYQTKELGDEEDGDKLYFCTEATITLRAHQGEKTFDFVKTVKLRQEYVDVIINIGINPDFDGENNTEV